MVTPLSKRSTQYWTAFDGSLRATQKAVTHVVEPFVKGATIPFKARLVANAFLNRCTHQNYVAGVLGYLSWNKW